MPTRHASTTAPLQDQIPADLRPDGPWCQRWRERRHSWRHRDEGGFRKERYEVTPIDFHAASSFVIRHHYAGAYVADTVHRYGLFDLEPDPDTCDGQLVGGAALVGVAVLGIPTNEKVLTNCFPDLAAYDESLELSRLVLLDSIPANAESWMLTRAFKQAAEGGIRGVVSFSDPMPRYRRIDGALRLVSPGHTGVIYTALTGGGPGGADGDGGLCRYTGTSKSEHMWFDRDGRLLPGRTLSKVRAGDAGADGAVRTLLALGARVPRAGENMSAWLDDVLPTVAEKRKTPGKHRYAFRLGRNRAERSRVTIALPARPFPQRQVA